MPSARHSDLNSLKCTFARGETMKKTFSNDKTYVSHAVLSYGDYDNSCAIERANVRVLEEKHSGFESYSFSDWDQGKQLVHTGHSCEWEDILPESEVVELYGSYGSIQIWIREDINKENGYTAALKQYPCLDDEAVSEIEMEIEEEYIKDLWPDLVRCYPDDFREALDLCGIDSLDQEIYEKAKDETNTYFKVEAGGNGYIDLARIAPAYLEELRFRNRALEILKGVVELKNNKPSFPLSFYDNAEDMLDHRDATGQGITTEEAREILKYAVELERQIETVVP